jgi:hypothetical protein
MNHQTPRYSFFPPASLLCFSLAFVSCSTSNFRVSGTPANNPLPAAGKVAGSQSEPGENDGRLRIYQASQTVEVADVTISARQAEEQVIARKGYVESSTARSNGESNATLTLRVPATEWRAILDDLAALGKETSRRTTAEDTTDAYFDLEAKLKNTAALRDRLRSLLDATKTVKEILEIEKELARVQTELDAMQSRFQRLQSQVRLAKIELALETRGIPGPIGAAGKGLWWSIRKLFVLK